jgi:hypothetical protein
MPKKKKKGNGRVPLQGGGMTCSLDPHPSKTIITGANNKVI